MGKRIVILGGGVGGLVAANELADRIGKEHRVILVDRSSEHTNNASLLWVMAGWRRPGQITKSLRRMLRPEVDVIRSEVRSIEPEKQRVRTDAGAMDYDYLIIALGAEIALAAIPGYSDAAHSFFTLEGVIKLTEAFKSFPGGRVAVLVTRLPYKCPAAPYEAALLLNDVFGRRGLAKKVDIQVYTPEVLPMPVAGLVLGQSVKGMIEQKGIGFHPNLQLESINPDKHELKFRDGTAAGFDLLVAVPPHRAPQALEGSNLTNDAGWIPVDRRTLGTSYNNIYAVGDITAVTLPNGKLLPKAGVFAHLEAQVVARRIASDILGTIPEANFDGLGYCWIEIGGGMAGFASGNFYAEPNPVIELHRPGRIWHWGKIQFENYWMGNSLKKEMARLSLVLGSKFLRIPASL